MKFSSSQYYFSGNQSKDIVLKLGVWNSKFNQSIQKWHCQLYYISIYQYIYLSQMGHHGNCKKLSTVDLAWWCQVPSSQIWSLLTFLWKKALIRRWSGTRALAQGLKSLLHKAGSAGPWWNGYCGKIYNVNIVPLHWVLIIFDENFTRVSLDGEYMYAAE